MKRQIKIGRLLAALLLVGSLAAACGTTPATTDPTPTTPEEKEILAKQLGVSVKALEAFEKASVELDKKAPDLNAARGLLEQALKESPNFLEAQYNMGIVSERLERYDEAIAAYNKTQQLDKLNSHSTKVLLAIGRAQSLAGKSEAAVKTFEEALRLDPENIDLLNSVGAAYLKAGKPGEAIEFVKKVLREENENVTALNTLAQIYAAQKNQSMAVYVFKKAARASLNAYSEDEINVEPAVLVLTDKVKLEKVDGAQAGDILNNLGMMYMQMGEMPLAVYNFDAAAKLDPGDVESRLNTGAIYLQYLNYDGARDLFSDALKANPSNCTARLGLSASHFGAGTRKKAIENYDIYLKNCNAEDPSVHYQLVRLHEREQNFDNAIAHCNLYVKHGEPSGDPNDINAAYCKSLESMKNMANQPMQPAGEGGEGGGDGLQPMDGGEELQPLDGGEERQPLDDEGMEELDGQGGEELQPLDDGAEGDGMEPLDG